MRLPGRALGRSPGRTTARPRRTPRSRTAPAASARSGTGARARAGPTPARSAGDPIDHHHRPRPDHPRRDQILARQPEQQRRGIMLHRTRQKEPIELLQLQGSRCTPPQIPSRQPKMLREGLRPTPVRAERIRIHSKRRSNATTRKCSERPGPMLLIRSSLFPRPPCSSRRGAPEPPPSSTHVGCPSMSTRLATFHPIPATCPAGGSRCGYFPTRPATPQRLGASARKPGLGSGAVDPRRGTLVTARTAAEVASAFPQSGDGRYEDAGWGSSARDHAIAINRRSTSRSISSSFLT